MSALSDPPNMWGKGAYNKIPASTSSERSYNKIPASTSSERSYELHAGSWRCLGTSNPIVNGIEESNEEIANLLEPIVNGIEESNEAIVNGKEVPPQFEDEWVSRGDLYIKVFKLFSYSHSSYVS